MKKRVVVALGHRALGTTLPEQKEAVKKTAKVIADMIAAGYQAAITHSNAPQVGMIHTAMNEFGKAHQDYTAAPMSVCSAMSQGYIGYDLQNAIREALLNEGVYRTVSTILTQVVVDPYDEAFYTPTKVLGRYMNAEEANLERKKGNYVVEEPGKGFRRIVSAPNPGKIVEIDAIRALLDADQVVIACGGGGIPVLQQDNHLKGASAVIEKDLTAGRLAEEVEADTLIILTSVEKVKLNMGRPEEEELGEITLEQAKQYMEEGHFGVYNMLPKFRAATEFIEKGEGREALITSFDKLNDALKGKTGTWIRRNRTSESRIYWNKSICGFLCRKGGSGMRLCELEEKEVINACDCKRLGFVADLIIEECTGRIEALIVPRGGKLCGFFSDGGEYVIPFGCVKKIGPDIILVEIHEKKQPTL